MLQLLTKTCMFCLSPVTARDADGSGYCARHAVHGRDPLPVVRGETVWKELVRRYRAGGSGMLLTERGAGLRVRFLGRDGVEEGTAWHVGADRTGLVMDLDGHAGGCWYHVDNVELLDPLPPEVK